MASYYELLQVPVDASDEAIRSSTQWARQAVAHDPDRERRLAAIDEAYETLREPTLRRVYDDQLAAGTAPSIAGNGVVLVAADAPLPLAGSLCSICGLTPATDFVVLRAMSWWSWRPPGDDRSYCRDHGRAEVAEANRYNLTAGWWRLPVNLIFAAINLNSLRRFSSLDPPSP